MAGGAGGRDEGRLVKRGPLLAGLAVLALAGGLVAYHRLGGPRLPAPPGPGELQRLRRERQALEDRFRKLTAEMDELDLAHAPKANVLIGVSPGFVRDLVEQAVTGLLREVRLSLRGLKAHHEDDIRATLLFKERKLGDFKLDLDVDRVKGLLHPGKPSLTFGGDRIGIRLPVSLVSGGGEATLRWRWDGRGLTGAVCGDMDVTRTVTAVVVPARYTIQGGFKLSTAQRTVVAEPQFGVVKIRLQVQPTEQAWAVVDQLVEEQGKLCEMALKKVDVRQKLEGVLAKGFDVTLPRALFRPIRLPATLDESLELNGRSVKLSVRPIGLALTSKRLWYGAQVEATK